MRLQDQSAEQRRKPNRKAPHPIPPAAPWNGLPRKTKRPELQRPVQRLHPGGESHKLDHGDPAWPPRQQAATPAAAAEPETKACLRAEPEVRIHLPPAVSLRTLGSGGGLAIA